MRNSNFKILMILFCLFFGVSCSDEDSGSNIEPEVESAIVPVNIRFVYANGNAINSNDCVSDSDEIAIEITTELQNSGELIPTQVNYTINGFLFSMTFSNASTQRNPIDLFDGNNIAQLSTTGQSTQLRFIQQDEFEEIP